MTLQYEPLRKELVYTAQQMYTMNLVGGTSGNVSVRIPNTDLVLITPSSMPYMALTPEDMVLIDFNGNVYTEGRSPSVEHIIHLKMYKVREDVGAVFHTHSLYASALAFLNEPLPALLEEMVVYVGGQIEVAEFGQTGTDDLAEKATKALGNRAAVLLANHGALCVGHTLAKGLNVAQTLERTAQIYIIARIVGTPNLLDEEIAATYSGIYDVTKGQP